MSVPDITLQFCCVIKSFILACYSQYFEGAYFKLFSSVMCAF